MKGSQNQLFLPSLFIIQVPWKVPCAYTDSGFSRNVLNKWLVFYIL